MRSTPLPVWWLLPPRFGARAALERRVRDAPQETVPEPPRDGTTHTSPFSKEVGGHDGAAVSGSVERHALQSTMIHKTVLNEFYRVAFRKKIYSTLEELQEDLDAWMREYNEIRSHQGRWCYGKTPMATFLDTAHVARDKMLRAA